MSAWFYGGRYGESIERCPGFTYGLNIAAYTASSPRFHLAGKQRYRKYLIRWSVPKCPFGPGRILSGCLRERDMRRNSLKGIHRIAELPNCRNSQIPDLLTLLWPYNLLLILILEDVKSPFKHGFSLPSQFLTSCMLLHYQLSTRHKIKFLFLGKQGLCWCSQTLFSTVVILACTEDVGKYCLRSLIHY